eukprot:13039681-Ditylum_brightwellii.AAC.1
MLNWMGEKYGKLRTTRRKIHDYLGMVLNFSKKGEVRISMIDYIKETIEDFPEAIEGTVATPAADHLFKVNKNAMPLDEEMARAFHTSTAKPLFLCKRARQDIQTPVAFLTTRVKNPDEYDWKKLRRVLLYLNDTVELVATLSAEALNVTK